MAAAKLEMPAGGKRASMGSGRARAKGFRIWLDDARYARLAQIAAAEGVTRTALVERWIDEHYVQLPPPEGYVPPEVPHG